MFGDWHPEWRGRPKVFFLEFTPLKFNSSPLKSCRASIGKDRLPTTIFSGALAVKL